jgi:hypothetical protein
LVQSNSKPRGVDAKPQSRVQIASKPFTSCQFGERCYAPPLSHPFLLDGNSALPVGQSGKGEGQYQSGGETAGKNIPPPRSRSAALPHK